MFENQIPQFPDFGRQPFPVALPYFANAVPEIHPSPGNPPQGWGLTFMLTDGATHKSPGTAQWAGVANLFWFVDPGKGIAGMISSQILPAGDFAVYDLWVNKVQATVFNALEGQNAS